MARMARVADRSGDRPARRVKAYNRGAVIDSLARRFVVFAVVALTLPLSASCIGALAEQPCDSGRGQPRASSAADLPLGRPSRQRQRHRPRQCRSAREKPDRRRLPDLRGRPGTKDRSLRDRSRPLAPTPSAASSSTPSTPAVFSNRLAERPAGGVTIILFDRLNSTWEDQKFARDQILKLLANIRSSDRVALYVLESDTITVLHDFTSESGRLIAVLNRYLGTTSVELARSDRASAGLCEERSRSGRRGDRSVVGSHDDDGGGDVFAAPRRADHQRARKHRQSSRRHSRTEKPDLGVRRVPVRDPQRSWPANHEQGSQSRHPRDQQRDVAVYPVDIAADRRVRESGAATATVNRAAHRGAGIHDDGETHPNQDTMRTIAEATGGRVYLNTNAIGEAIRKAIDDSRVSYVSATTRPVPKATTNSATSTSRSTAAASSSVIARAISRRRSPAQFASAARRARPRDAEPDRGLRHQPDGGDRACQG